MSTFDLIYAWTIRILSSTLGFGIAVWETLGDHAAHPWAYAAATGFIGGPVARALTELVRLMADSEGTVMPPTDPTPPAPDLGPK